MKRLKNRTLYVKEIIQNSGLISLFRIKQNDLIIKGEIDQITPYTGTSMRMKNNGNLLIETIIEE